ncbi:hypothetical protein ACIQCQ_33040 [Streptomyces sp. NPDC088394]|uniref:hypothetical protein n=1 Tax=Streptomyces sp. NPDC088394 TaxID=3365860 RepID=UPI00380717AA
MLDIESEAGEELMRFTRQKVAEAMKSGIDALGNRAVPVIDDPVHRFAEVFERSPDTKFREWMAKQFEEAHDPGVDRYWRLVWLVNGRQVVPKLIPVCPWFVQALRSGSTLSGPRGAGRGRAGQGRAILVLGVLFLGTPAVRAPVGRGRPTWSAEAGDRSRTKVDAAGRHRFAVRIVEADPDVRAAADDIRGKCGGHRSHRVAVRTAAPGAERVGIAVEHAVPRSAAADRLQRPGEVHRPVVPGQGAGDITSGAELPAALAHQP